MLVFNDINTNKWPFPNLYINARAIVLIQPPLNHVMPLKAKTQKAFITFPHTFPVYKVIYYSVKGLILNYTFGARAFLVVKKTCHFKIGLSSKKRRLPGPVKGITKQCWLGLGQNMNNWTFRQKLISLGHRQHLWLHCYKYIGNL